MCLSKFESPYRNIYILPDTLRNEIDARRILWKSELVASNMGKYTNEVLTHSRDDIQHPFCFTATCGHTDHVHYPAPSF